MIGRIAKWFAAMPLLTGMARGRFRAGIDRFADMAGRHIVPARRSRSSTRRRVTPLKQPRVLSLTARTVVSECQPPRIGTSAMLARRVRDALLPKWPTEREMMDQVMSIDESWNHSAHDLRHRPGHLILVVSMFDFPWRKA
jgi:hypothetical protein